MARDFEPIPQGSAKPIAFEYASENLSQVKAPVHTSQEILKNGVFTLKTHQSPVSLDLCLRKTRAGKSNYYREDIVSESSVFKMVPSTLKRKAGVFKFLRFEERFRKAPFS